MKFDKEYFTSNNYTDYLSRGDRYKKLAEDIDKFLTTICLQDKNNLTLDFGCGVGMLTKALTELKYNVLGYDISEWAVSWALEHTSYNAPCINITNNLENILSKNYNLTIMLDVLEHMTLIDINSLFNKLKTNFVLIRIPVANEYGEFILPVSKKDPTHITALSKKAWNEMFISKKYSLLNKINLPNIWDSDGVFCALYVNNKYKNIL